ncbi:MAG: polysaccharide export protein [Acidobacteriia bacterium]|nr:polysaccharide export protein [Terriglobia bacterium]
MRRPWITMVAALCLMTGFALAQNSAPKQASGHSAAEKTANASPSSQAGPEYVIGPEDVLLISVWKEADLTATLPVRPDGKISLPLLSDVQAAGLTPIQLAESVTEKLKKYIADPRVTVVVTQINSKRIYMVGEVAHTGPMPMLPNMTALQALSSAGLTQFANTKGIYILRMENGKQQKMPVNYRKLVKGEQMEQNYLLQPGDTIVVP